MKKAFTLIEVMVSVIIFFITVMAVFDVVKNNTRLISLIQQNNDFSLKASVAVLSPQKKNNYERLKEFNITNDEVIRDLKKDKITVEIKPDLNMEYNISGIRFKETVNKLKAFDKTDSITVYSVGIK